MKKFNSWLAKKKNDRKEKKEKKENLNPTLITQPTINNSNFKALPLEILFEVFSYLSPDDLSRVNRVNKYLANGTNRFFARPNTQKEIFKLLEELHQVSMRLESYPLQLTEDVINNKKALKSARIAFRHHDVMLNKEQAKTGFQKLVDDFKELKGKETAYRFLISKMIINLLADVALESTFVTDVIAKITNNKSIYESAQEKARAQHNTSLAHFSNPEKFYRNRKFHEKLLQKLACVPAKLSSNEGTMKKSV